MKLGDPFAEFVLLGRIGTGGMGTVYAAFDARELDFVALKTLRSGLDDEEKHRDRFHREGDIYGRISHPNIVGFKGTGVFKGTNYIALELVRGRSLSKIIEEFHTNPLPFDRVVNIIIDLVKAVEHIHTRRIIHRDIKPSNVILTQDDIVKLIDFGIADEQGSPPLTRDGTIVGTVCYSSPEQNSGRPTDERSDLYSIGCVFYELLTGQRALPGSSLAEVSQFQALPSLALPSNFNPKVPSCLDQIVKRLLMPSPKDRYQTATELLADLQTVKQMSADAAQGGGAEIVFDQLSESWEAAKDAFVRGDIDKALALANLLKTQKNNDARVHFLLGKLYTRKNLPFNATEAFGEAIALDDGNEDYAIDFCLALVRLEMYHQCVEQAGVLLERNPKNVLAAGLKYLAGIGYDSEIDRTEPAAAGQAVVPAPPTIGSFGQPVPKNDSVNIFGPPGAGQASGGGSLFGPAGRASMPPMSPGRSVASSSPGRVIQPPPLSRPGAAAGTTSSPGRVLSGRPPVAPPPPPPGSTGPAVSPPGRTHVPSSSPGRSVSPPTLTDQPRTLSSLRAESGVKSGQPPRLATGASDSVEPVPVEGKKHREDGRDVSIAYRARWLSTLFPGLGHLYLASIGGFIRESVIGLVLLCLIVWIFVLTPGGKSLLRQYELMPYFEDVIDMGVDCGLENFVNKNVPRVPPRYWRLLLMLFPTMLFLLHWARCRRIIYNGVLSALLLGKVSDVRPDGMIVIDRGSRQGVEVGMIFTVKKGATTRSISAFEAQAIRTTKIYQPIGRAKVVYVDEDGALAQFRNTGGMSAQPGPGDRVDIKF